MKIILSIQTQHISHIEKTVDNFIYAIHTKATGSTDGKIHTCPQLRANLCGWRKNSFVLSERNSEVIWKNVKCMEVACKLPIAKNPALQLLFDSQLPWVAVMWHIHVSLTQWSTVQSFQNEYSPVLGYLLCRRRYIHFFNYTENF